MDIKRIVRNLVKKYKTSDPFELMDALDIIWIKRPLPENVRGFYFNKMRRKIVVINEIYEEKQQVATAAHELGHCIFHPSMNAIFLERNTFFISSRYENEANQFAVELLMYETDMTEYEGYTIEQIAKALNIPEKLIKMRCYIHGKSEM